MEITTDHQNVLHEIAIDRRPRPLVCARYSVALMEVAKADGLVQQAIDVMLVFRSLLSPGSKLLTFVTSAVVPRAAKEKVIGALSEKLGLEILLRNFLLVVARRNRLNFLPGIIDDFLSRASQDRCEVVLEVESAHPMSSSEQKELLALLEKQMKKKSLSIHVTLNPALLGGLTLRHGSHMIDATIRSKLDRLSRYLQNKPATDFIKPGS